MQNLEKKFRQICDVLKITVRERYSPDKGEFVGGEGIGGLFNFCANGKRIGNIENILF